MRFLRSCVTGFCFALFGLGSISLGTGLFPLLFLLPQKNRHRVMLTLNRWAWRIFVEFVSVLHMISVRLENEAVLRETRGSIVVANHPTLIDVVLLLAYTPHTVCVVKGALLKNVFMRGVVRMVHLCNDLPSNIFVEKAEDVLSRGYNILIFPEGTRTVPGKKSTLHRGAAQLALFAGTDIVPVKISVSPPILGKHQPWWDLSDRRVKFVLTVLEPISPQPFAEKTRNRHVCAKRVTEAFWKKIQNAVPAPEKQKLG